MRRKPPARRRDDAPIRKHDPRARLRLDWERFEERLLLSTFTVRSTADNADDLNPTPGSLRAAIVAANADTDPSSTILFEMDADDPRHFYYRDDGISGQVSRASVAVTSTTHDTTPTDADADHPQSWWSFQPAAGLPVITGKVVIDGYSQAGATPNGLPSGNNAVLRIELNGASLRVGDGCTIRGVVVNRVPFVGNGGSGIEIGGNRGLVTGSFIGTDVSGTLALGNDLGIMVFGTGNTIGGTTPGARNVISGNVTGIETGFTSGNVIQGNYIGTDLNGTRAVANRLGVRVNSEGDRPGAIGGTAAGAGNLISGNDLGLLFNGLSSATAVHGNYIGTDATGMAPLGNTNGVVIWGGDGTIGGTEPGEGNVISGNAIGIGGGGGIRFQGNLIGTNKDGTAAVGNVTGFYLGESSNNTIGGTAPGARNIISGNNVGIHIFSVYADRPSTGNVIQGNFIGTDVSGTHAIGNGRFGSGISFGRNASHNTVGGTTPEARNIISGNLGDGIGLGRFGNDEGAVPSDNVIQGNYIGTDVTGMVAIANGNIGVNLVETSDNTVGGIAPGAGNVIASGGLAGVWLGTTTGSPTTVTGNVVQGNFIGTNKDGDAPLPNGTGVVLHAGGGVADNLIGGTTPGARNVISGNREFGVAVWFSTNNRVLGNYIGTDVTGSQSLGNGGGVSLAHASHGNAIGGPAPGEGNVIAHSTRHGGIWLETTNVFAQSPVGDTFRGNSIHNNAGLGIDLGRDGVTANGSRAGQPGPNNWQAFPVLTPVRSGRSDQAAGTFHGSANTAFTLDFYGSDAPDASGFGEGRQYLGSLVVTSDASGNASFDFPLGEPAADWITATATGPSSTLR